MATLIMGECNIREMPSIVFRRRSVTPHLVSGRRQLTVHSLTETSLHAYMTYGSAMGFTSPTAPIDRPNAPQLDYAAHLVTGAPREFTSASHNTLQVYLNL